MLVGCDSSVMLTETYIEALLVDEELVDQVREAWDSGEADDQSACTAWSFIAGLVCRPDRYQDV